MAIRGAAAKDYVTKKIQETFGPDFLGIVDKKLYINVKENGENLQVAISLTCPKENLEFDSAPSVKNDEGTAATAQFTQKEKETIEELMRRVGL